MKSGPPRRYDLPCDARPFIGGCAGNQRTGEFAHDWVVEPASTDRAAETTDENTAVVSVGKIAGIYANFGGTKSDQFDALSTPPIKEMKEGDNTIVHQLRCP